MPVSKKQSQRSLGSPFWEKQVKNYKASQLSQGEYCRQNNLKLSAFGYWYRKLNHQESEKEYSPKGFIEISGMLKNQNQNGSTANAFAEIEFRNGWKLKIPPGWQHQSLKMLLALIKEEACL
jgi:hypothetical protein